MPFVIMRASKATLPLLTFSTTAMSTFVHSCRTSLVLQHPQCTASYSSTTSGSGQSFTYRLAASFSGKDTYHKSNRDSYTFTTSRPSHKHFDHRKPSSRANSGQDAFFITSVGGTGITAFGIADGVGGWQDSGVDSADFSHGLCHYLGSRAESADPAKAAYLRPGSLLQDAYDDVIRDPHIDAGGSTACVAVAGMNGSVEVANLGDSGFVQLRPGKVHYASEPQTHAFNTPFQLSLVPPEIQAQSQAFGGDMLQDLPDQAEISRHTVKHGDVLVFASDGVWDNLSAADVLDVIGRFMTSFHAWGTNENEAQEVQGEKDPNVRMDLLDGLTRDGGIPTKDRTLQAALAIAVAGEAKMASLDNKRDGPFAREVQRHYPESDWQGGKVDDVSVVVAIVVGVENE